MAAANALLASHEKLLPRCGAGSVVCEGVAGEMRGVQLLLMGPGKDEEPKDSPTWPPPKGKEGGIALGGSSRDVSTGMSAHPFAEVWGTTSKPGLMVPGVHPPTPPGPRLHPTLALRFTAEAIPSVSILDPTFCAAHPPMEASGSNRRLPLWQAAGCPPLPTTSSFEEGGGCAPMPPPIANELRWREAAMG